MKREIHSLIQGSPEWHAFRACHDGASEAAAMLGLSKHTTRTELLAQKSTGIAKEVSAFTQAILDRGHAVEALGRPIAEEIIGEDIYPATYSVGRMSASCDGLTIDGSTAWEHKQHSAGLSASILRGELPAEHMPQCQQTMYVAGASRMLFMVSDGTRETNDSMWVNVDLQWQNRLLAGWEQFNLDLAAYVHVEAAPAAVATPTMALPALNIQVNGSLTLIDNLSVFGGQLRAFIEGIDKSPSDDQAFADAEAAIKTLEKAEGALQAAEAGALAQAAGIEEMRRTVALYADLARTTRLVLEKMVRARKETIKIEIIDKGKTSLADHVAALNSQIGKSYMPAVPADFAGAVKGLRTVASMLGAVGVELARAIIAANAVAGNIHLNLSAIRELGGDYKFLFVDEASIVLKNPDDLIALIKLRISTHKEAEAERVAAHQATEAREKILADERAHAAYDVVAQEFAALDAAREVKHAIVVDINRDTIKTPTNAQLVESVAIYWGVGESIAVEWLEKWQPVRSATIAS